MKKIAFLSLAIIIMSCGQPEKDSSSNSVTAPVVEISPAVDMAAIKKEFSYDINQVSYCFGQNVRQKVLQQGVTELIESEFVSSFARAKTDTELNIQDVNAKLNEIRQAQGKYPDSRRELSKNMGYYYGITEGRSDFTKSLNIGLFANGFIDSGKRINNLGFNCDSLYNSEQKKYNEFLGKRYLEENKKRAGVQSTATGLQYEVLVLGDGELPNENSEVTVHYEGTLVSGEVFDSSIKRGKSISFNLQGVIAGWTEGLQLMPKGSTYKFYIPYEIGYGGSAAGKIPPYSTLIFEVQLIDF